MRVGIRGAISGLVLTSIIVSAVGVHLLWWRTAQQVSQTLADTINDQIVSAVGDQLQSITTEARSASSGFFTRRPAGRPSTGISSRKPPSVTLMRSSTMKPTFPAWSVFTRS